MPTNRPFFANFLAVFRAHSSPAYKAASSATSPSALSSSAHVSTTSSTATSTITTSSARSIVTKATPPASQPTSNNTSSSPQSNGSNAVSAAAAAAAAAVATSPHIHHGPPLSRSPGVSNPHSTSMSPPGGTSTPLPGSRQRRGSDSSNSSGGFIDALGTEKWYIGGRTAAGEEKFYSLGLVTGAPGRRVRSRDRLSL